MFNKLFGSIFGTRHERERKRVQPIIDDIVAIEELNQLRELRHLRESV